MEAWERIKLLMEVKKLNPTSLSKSVGIDNNVTIGKIINHQRNPIKATLERIAAAFPDINREWIMTGEGEMLNSDHNQDNEIQNNNLPFNKFRKVGVKAQSLITSEQVDAGEKIAEGSKVLVEVELVRKDAYVAYLANWQDESFIQTLPTKLTMVKNYEKDAIYRAFDVSGSGMDCDKKYAIEDGDTVTCIKVAKEYWSTKLRIKQHRVWIVVYDEGIILTHIFNHATKEGVISCRFYNEDKTYYPDIEIDLSTVSELFYVISLEKPM